MTWLARFRRRRNPAPAIERCTAPDGLEHRVALVDAHGLTTAVCLCGWERSLSSRRRCVELGRTHETHHIEYP